MILNYRMRMYESEKRFLDMLSQRDRIVVKSAVSHTKSTAG